MPFNPNRTEFATYAHWLVWRCALDMAPVLAPARWDSAHLALHGFLRDLYADLFRQPQAYGIPTDAYSSCEQLLPDAARNAIQPFVLRARKALIEGVLTFLYQLGQRATVTDDALSLDRTAFAALTKALDRHAKAAAALSALGTLGLAQRTTDDQVVFTSPTRPGLTLALAAFSHACAANAENGFYAFRRGDFAGYSPTWAPDFAAALNMVPSALTAEVTAMDTFLRGLGLKRTVLTESSSGYRVVYERSRHKLAYWCRIRTPFHPVVYHRLRWDLSPEVTAALFTRLGETSPGLAELIFSGLGACAGCRPDCSARRVVSHGGVDRACCLDVGWERIAVDADGFASARVVAQVLVELPAQESSKPR